MKMKLKILVFIFGLCALNIKAQGLKVVYNLFEIQNDKYIEVEGLYFELIIKDGKSLFTSHKPMDIDSNTRYGTIIRRFASGNYYVDVSECINLVQAEIFETIYLIEEEFNTNWVIESKFKEILGYNCQMATRNSIVDKIGKTVTKEVWFAKDINFNFGPYDTYNLPGLILAHYVKGHNFITMATKISTYNDEVELPEGMRISLENLEEKMQEYMRNN